MKRILVTGGGGFVGGAIVKQALNQGLECRVIGRNIYPHIQAIGAESIQCDLKDRERLVAVCAGVDTVIHTAALAGVWGSWQKYYETNVLGTENVLHACQKNGIANLVYTSTPSVVFNRKDLCGGNETLPYATDFLCNYAKSKVIAEQKVLAANCETLATCAIRPHLVWGPGDPHLIPRLLEQGRKKQLKIVGRGNNLVDISFVENVAQAHLQAARNLSDTRTAAGKAYFISQGKPVVLWRWINELFERLGIEPISNSVPFWLAYGIGGLLEGLHAALYPEKEPRMTRFVAEQLAKSHYFSTKQAEKDFGYVPQISTEEGMEKLVEWIYEHEKISANT